MFSNFKGSDQHLTPIGSADFMYVNTTIMYNDFVRAFERLREEFKNDERMMSRAAERLEWREDEDGEQDLDIPVSPPPPIEFIWAR